MTDAPTISTHVLDVEHGQPAAGVAVELFLIAEDGGRLRVGQATTDSDGRVRRLLDGVLVAADYEIEFSLPGPFFRRVTLSFRVEETSRSYHVPLLLGPYALTAYRGS